MCLGSLIRRNDIIFELIRDPGIEEGSDLAVMQRQAHKAHKGKGKPGRLSCQADDCQERLSKCKAYCARYRVCPTHLIAQRVPVKGVASRFCQQCAKFHVVEDFDGSKRSCRIQLARHNDSRKQRRKEAAEQQQVVCALATLHQLGARSKSKKKHISSSTEDDCAPASGSSSSSQQPPSAGSTATEDESLSALVVRVQSQHNLQQQPQSGTAAAADQQQMAPKGQDACKWQQQQQRSGSSDVDCCDELQHDKGHPVQIGPVEGILAVADAELRMSQTSREPSPTLDSAVGAPTAAAAVLSGESSFDASFFPNAARIAAATAAAAAAEINDTTLHDQPTHRPRLYTPFAAVGSSAHNTQRQGILPTVFSAIQQQQQHKSLSQHNRALSHEALAASDNCSNPYALHPLESTDPADANEITTAAAALSFVPAAEQNSVNSGGQQPQIEDIPLPFGSPLLVPVFDAEDVSQVAGSKSRRRDGRKDCSQVHVLDSPCLPSAAAAAAAAAAQGHAPPPAAAAAPEDTSVAEAAKGLCFCVERQQAAGRTGDKMDPVGTHLSNQADLAADRLAAITTGWPTNKRTSRKRSARFSILGDNPVQRHARDDCARPAAAAAAAAAVQSGQPASSLETAAAAASAAAATHHVLSEELVATSEPHRVGCGTCTFPRCPQCADTAAAAAAEATMMQHQSIGTPQQQQQHQQAKQQQHISGAEDAGSNVQFVAAAAAAEACQQYLWTVETGQTCIEPSELHAAVAAGSDGGTSETTLSTMHGSFGQQQQAQQQGGHSGNIIQTSRAAQVPAHLQAAPLNASRSVAAAAAAAAVERVHACSTPQPTDTVDNTHFVASGIAAHVPQLATASTTAAAAAAERAAAPLEPFGSIQWCHQTDQMQQQQQQLAKRRALPLRQLPLRNYSQQQQQQQQHAVVPALSTQVTAEHQQQQQQQEEAHLCSRQRPVAWQHLERTFHAGQQQQQQSGEHPVSPGGWQQATSPNRRCSKLTSASAAGARSCPLPMPLSSPCNRMPNNQTAVGAIAAVTAQSFAQCSEYQTTSFESFPLLNHSNSSSKVDHGSSSIGDRSWDYQEPPADWTPAAAAAAATGGEIANAAAVRGPYPCTMYASPWAVVAFSMRTPFAPESMAYGPTAHQLIHHLHQQRQRAVQPSSDYSNEGPAIKGNKWQMQHQQYPPHAHAHFVHQLHDSSPQRHLQQQGIAANAQYGSYSCPASTLPAESALLPQQQMMLQGCSAQDCSPRTQGLSPGSLCPRGLSPARQHLRRRSVSPQIFSPRGQLPRRRSLSPQALSPRAHGLSPRSFCPQGSSPRGQGLSPRWPSPRGFSPRCQGTSPRYCNGSGFPVRDLDLDCKDLYHDWTHDASCFDDMMLDELLAPGE